METTSSNTTQALTVGERVTFFPNCGGQITGTIVAPTTSGSYSVREDDGYIHTHGLHRVRGAVAA